MKKKCLLHLLLITTLNLYVLVFIADAQQKPINVICVGAYEQCPNIYTDNDGSIVGLFPDILNYIAKQEGWNIQYVSGTWAECLRYLDNKQIDIMPGIAYSQKGDKDYKLSEETVFVDWAKIYTNSDLTIESILDLQNKTIAVLKNSIYTTGEDGIKALTRKFNINCTFIEVGDPTEIFELLDEKKADAGVVSRIYGSLLDYYYNINKTSIVFSPRELRFAYHETNNLSQSIINKLDRHINKLKENPKSIFYTIIEVNIFGLPREWIHTGIPREKIKRIPLTDKEQQWVRSHPIIRLGIDPEFFPFESVSKNGVYGGVASDYITLLNKRLGLNMQVVEKSSWAKAVTELKNGKVDVLPCIGRTGERVSFVKYTRPYVFFHRVIITPTDTPFLQGIEDITNCRVGVQANSSHEGYLKDHTDIQPVLFNTLQEALLAVSNGKTDAFVGNIASATYWIRKMKLTNLKVAAPVSSKLETLHLGVRNDWPELVRILNKGLASITPDERAEIERRWIVVEYKPGFDPQIVWKHVSRGIAVACVIILIFILWNYKLKHEITKRIKAEKQLKHYQNNLKHIIKEQTTELAEANRSLAEAQRIAHLGNWDWDIKNDHFHWTDEIYRIFGLKKQDYEVEHGMLINSIHPDDRKNVEKIIDQALQQGKPYSIEYRVILPDKSQRIVHECAEVAFDKNNSPAHITAAIQDITKTKQDEQAQLILINDLEQKNAEMELFFYTISHELKTPLITIEGFLNILKSELQSKNYDNSEHYIARIISANKIMYQILDDLLEIAKVGRFVNPTEKVRFRDLIEESIKHLEGTLIDKNIKIDIKLPDDFPPIICDRKRLFEVTVNLLENAIKFSETVPEPYIEIGATVEQSRYKFYIKDNGIGIKKKYSEKIFGLFNKLDPGKEGSGIGLTLVKRIIEYHKGEIWLKSGGTGKGSTFYFTLPK